ncbi:OmpA family protein [Crocinitomicaceae bacterium]|nr:OmpA family protein [Crocinitomicaceae bacterium]
MKFLGGLFILSLLFVSCVPVKKYEELVEKEKRCSEELAKYKNDALNFEADATDLRSKHALLTKQVTQLKTDTTELGGNYRTLLAKYDKLAKINEALETNYGKLRLTGAKESASLHADLTAKQLELQRKEDKLLTLEKELIEKQALLSEREQRVNELEKIIRDQDAAAQRLKEKVSNALKGFINKGLKVEERNGKIYVSLEAKLLFQSGSTSVENEGKTALIDLARVLESETELEIIVEGHTDTDKMAGTKHPKNNWELSVLRSTAVIEIMLGNSNLKPSQVMAAGRSEFLPVDINDKAKNRRIEIIISPNLNELYELINN